MGRAAPSRFKVRDTRDCGARLMRVRRATPPPPPPPPHRHPNTHPPHPHHPPQPHPPSLTAVRVGGLPLAVDHCRQARGGVGGVWGGAGSERVEYIEGAVHTDRQPSTLLSTLRGLPPRCRLAAAQPHTSQHTRSSALRRCCMNPPWQLAIRQALCSVMAAQTSISSGPATLHQGRAKMLGEGARRLEAAAAASHKCTSPPTLLAPPPTHQPRTAVE